MFAPCVSAPGHDHSGPRELAPGGCKGRRLIPAGGKPGSPAGCGGRAGSMALIRPGAEWVDLTRVSRAQAPAPPGPPAG